MIQVDDERDMSRRIGISIKAEFHVSYARPFRLSVEYSRQTFRDSSNFIFVDIIFNTKTFGLDSNLQADMDRYGEVKNRKQVSVYVISIKPGLIEMGI